MKLLIVGGGIGGLTTAIALKKFGFDCEVFESASEFGQVGSGLWVAPNAMKIFSRLDLAEEIQAAGSQCKAGAIMTYDGKVLGDMEGDKIFAKHGCHITAIHRAYLHEILCKHAGVVRTGKHFVRYEEVGEKVVVHFADGSSAEGDIVVGADGIKSLVRQQMLGDVEYRYSGQTCWRLMTEYSEEMDYGMVEMWGDRGGLRVGSGKVLEDLVYTFITAKAERGGVDNKETLKSDLLELCRVFPEITTELIQRTPVDKILRNDLYDFKPLSQWYNDRVVLVGDSAHATTPNLGQGACQAIESAYVLAQSLKECGTVEEAFARYQSMRKKKAHHVTNASWQMGQMVNIENRFGQWLRNTMMLMTPSWYMQRVQDRLYSVD